MTRHNACPNPALANDATGWSGDGTGGRTAVTGFTRPWAMQVTSAVYIQSARSAVGPSETWTLSCEIRASAAGTIGVYVDRFRADSSPIGSVGPVNVPVGADTVTTLSATITTPADCAAIAITPVLPASTVTYAVTAVMIEQVGALDTYADGDTPGWEWDGAAGSSTSSESTAVPLTLADSPTGTRAGGAAGELLAGVTTTAYPAGGRAGAPPGTLALGATGHDRPSGVRGGGPGGRLLLGVSHHDTPGGLWAGGPSGLFAADVLHADHPDGVRLGSALSQSSLAATGSRGLMGPAYRRTATMAGGVR